MRIDASRLKYLAFVVGLGACFFDPKATGPGNIENPQFMDGSVPSEGGAGAGNSGGASGRGGASGEGASGTGAVSGGASGTGGVSASGSGGAGIGGMSGGMAGGPPPPPPLANGEACTEDARCMSGHCDGICCDKGAECCKTVDDCTTQPGGLGMSCDDRTQCRGSAGKITCTSEFKCVTINGQRDDRACTNRVEANDCGLYNSVFCLGGELQSGAPECATACTSDSDCDAEAHCSAEKECVADLPNGEPCTRPEDCASSFCRNMVNGVGICCGLVGDCCKEADDCPDRYRREPTCDNLQGCRGSRMNAVCSFNICSSQVMQANEACNGMVGDDCGNFQDLVCMAGRNNMCRTSCTNIGQCDADAFCDNGVCVEKRPNGQPCTMANQCQSNVCTNNVCCAPGIECCSNANQCTRMLEAECHEPMQCQGRRNAVECMNARCVYGAKVDDDSACRTGRNECGFYDPIMCTGAVEQLSCPASCIRDEDCDENAECRAPGGGEGTCMLRGGGMGGMGGMGGASAAPGNGSDPDDNVE